MPGISPLKMRSFGSIARSRPSRVVDRKSTRLNSSHLGNSYADFCLKKRNELVPLAPVELLDGPDQPEVSFRDQVQEQHAGADVLLGDADDEAEVGLDQAAFRLLVPS